MYDPEEHATLFAGILRVLHLSRDLLTWEVLSNAGNYDYFAPLQLLEGPACVLPSPWNGLNMRIAAYVEPRTYSSYVYWTLLFTTHGFHRTNRGTSCSSLHCR